MLALLGLPTIPSAAMALNLERILADAPWQDTYLVAQGDRSILEQESEIRNDLERMQAALRVIPEDNDIERNVRAEAKEAVYRYEE